MELADWRGDFRKPKKIQGGSDVKVSSELSEDEYQLLQEYASGASMDTLARKFRTHKSTIQRSIRAIILKLCKAA